MIAMALSSPATAAYIVMGVGQRPHVAKFGAVLLWHKADASDMTVLIRDYNHVQPRRKKSKCFSNLIASR